MCTVQLAKATVSAKVCTREFVMVWRFSSSSKLSGRFFFWANDAKLKRWSWLRRSERERQRKFSINRIECKIIVSPSQSLLLLACHFRIRIKSRTKIAHKKMTIPDESNELKSSSEITRKKASRPKRTNKVKREKITHSRRFRFVEEPNRLSDVIPSHRYWIHIYTTECIRSCAGPIVEIGPRQRDSEENSSKLKSKYIHRPSTDPYMHIQ